jgi:D-alanyl-D-alanine dipeptidase
VEGWKAVPIDECAEKMVPIDESEKMHVHPIYQKKGYKSAEETVFVRERVAELLIAAADKLPDGYGIVILDGWRALSLQRELFEEQVEKLEARGIPPSRLIKEAQKYVSCPSDDPVCPPPHSTGGAVDLTITTPDGWMDAGCDFDTWTEIAGTRYYERLAEQQSLSPNQIRVLRTRRGIYHLLTSVGFSSYPEEWWHFDFGNQFWAKATNQSYAIYGRISRPR